MNLQETLQAMREGTIVKQVGGRIYAYMNEGKIIMSAPYIFFHENKILVHEPLGLRSNYFVGEDSIERLGPWEKT